MAAPFALPHFVRDETALATVLLTIKLVGCPHCRKTGMLIGHGFLRGYAERSSEVLVRGRRIFCSNRGRQRGCGRTFSVKLTTVLAGFVVRTLTLWFFASSVLAGLTRRAAWLREGALSLSSGYRLWRRLRAAQSTLRVQLCREAPAPVSRAPDPLAQLFEHLGVVVGARAVGGDLLEAFQSHVQRGVLER